MNYKRIIFYRKMFSILFLVVAMIGCEKSDNEIWPGYWLLLFGNGYQQCSLDMLSNEINPVFSIKNANRFNGARSDEYILVQTDEGKTLQDLSRYSSGILGKFHGEDIKSLQSANNIYRMKKPDGLTLHYTVSELKKTGGIRKVQPDYPVYVTAIPDDVEYGLQWGLKNSGQTVDNITGISGIDINAEAAWNINTDCSSVSVGIIDSGINFNHEDLALSKWYNSGEIAANGVDDDGNGFIDDVYGWDFVDSDNIPDDILGHGTHVAGIAGSAGNNLSGVSGVCWKSSMLSLRVINGEGIGYSSDIIEAVNYATAKGISVLNMSLGFYDGQDNDLVYDALQAYTSNGGLVVAAAGNDGNDNDISPLFPASYSLDNIISVGAVNSLGQASSFSNFGKTSVDIFAPGENIHSSYPLQTKNSYIENFYSGLDNWNFSGNAGQWKTEFYTNPSSGQEYCVLSDPSTDLSTYANNWDTMTYRQYDMSGADLGYIRYQLKIDTEPVFDNFYVKYNSYGGIPDQTLQTLSGNIYGSSGWFEIQKVIGADMLSGEFNFGFHLETNGSGTANGVSVSSLQVYSLNLVNNRYVIMSGTSMAAPFVSGIAALLMSYSNTNLLNCTNLHIKNAILENGTGLTDLTNLSVKAGIPNAGAALNFIVTNGCP